jgi:transketolase
MLSEAAAAADQLAAERNLSVKVLNLPWLNRIDAKWLGECIGNARYVFTIDNHYRAGGQGERIATAVAELGLNRPPRVHRFGLDDIPVSGTNDEALRHHRLDRQSLAAEIGRRVAAEAVVQ